MLRFCLVFCAIILSAVACAPRGDASRNEGANSISVANNAITNNSAATPIQDNKPPLSPPETATATIGGKKITINYSAPSMRGRKIVGGLVPYDAVWRTGANAATTLITDADLTIGGLTVPAGTYTIYSLPSASGWKLIINKQTKQWGTEYHEEQDLGRVDMQVKPVQPAVELFRIDITPQGNKAGKLSLTWENTEASVPFTIKG